MKMAFIGGGSLRVLPIVRSLLRRGILRCGSVSLIDLDINRSEAVAAMVRRCPEYAGSECQVRKYTGLKEGLEGVDLLYVTMAVVREPSYSRAYDISREYGVWCSDQLSPEGSFLAARSGGAILHFAEVLGEVGGAHPLMLIFANPVAVFSAMVNASTRVQALGICQGFQNHRWDIPRMTGRDGYVPGVKVVSTGVNHFAFILRGKWDGKDIFNVIDDCLDKMGDNYAEITRKRYPGILGVALAAMLRSYKLTGQMLFSSEADGLVNISRDDIVDFLNKQADKTPRPDDPAAFAREDIRKRYEHFYKLVDSPDNIWDGTEPLCGVDSHDLSNEICAALTGQSTFRIAASALNNGAVKDVPANYVLEYTMDIHGHDIVPVPNQYIPSPFHGLVTQYAEHQTLLADAIAEMDPSLFADALLSDPETLNIPRANEFYRRMIDAHPDLPDFVQETRKLL